MLSKLDQGIILIYIVICFIIGLVRNNKDKNLKEYTIGFRYLPTSLWVMTIFATEVGAGSSIGIIQKIYEEKGYFLIIQSFVVFHWILMYCVMPQGVGRFSNCISLIDVMEQLYGKWGKYISSISGILMTIVLLASQITALGYLFNTLLNVSFNIGVIIGFGTVVFYSYKGGMRAVTTTDIFQFFIFMVALPIIASYAYKGISVDGILESISFKEEKNIDYESFISSCFYMMTLGINLPYIQRILIIKDKTQLKQVIIGKALVAFFYYTTLVIIGLSLILLYKPEQVNQSIVFYRYIFDYIPIGVKGLIIIGILSLIMSSADSWLNSSSIICARNFFKEIYPNISNEKEVWIAKISLLIIACISLYIAKLNKGIFELMMLATSCFNPLIFMPFIVGFLGFKFSENEYIKSTIITIVFLIVMCVVKGELNSYVLMLGTLFNIFIILSIIFYHKAKLLKCMNVLK
jgi:Na+/proline symporter